MNRLIEDVDFVIFDVETTGLNPAGGDRICEIAAIKQRGTRELERFNSLVNPGFPMPTDAQEIHHIGDDLLARAPNSNSVLPRFLDFIKGSVLTGYNVGFDLGFLENELGLVGKKVIPSTPVIDILKMSRRLFPEQQSYSLANVSRALAIEVPQIHRAMADVELTARVFAVLLKRLSAHKISDFLTMHNLFGLNMELIEEANKQKVAQIMAAIERKARLRIAYFTSYSAEVSEREVTPKEIRQEHNRSYLVGFCHLRGEDRTFRIDSIVSIQPA
jgi:DNA polymerase III epsilon subunit family exonuclease